MERVDLQPFINGEWMPCESGETFEVINPVNGRPMEMGEPVHQVI